MIVMIDPKNSQATRYERIRSCYSEIFKMRGRVGGQHLTEDAIRDALGHAYPKDIIDGALRIYNEPIPGDQWPE